MGQQINDVIIMVADKIENLGPIFGSLFIVLESIIPVLPLSIFIALNVVAFGFLFGFIISYISTVVGCVIAFYLSRNILKRHFYKHIKDEGKVFRFMKKISNMRLSSLVLIIAIPFSPAFLINICAGLSEMSFRKFLASVLIGKLAIVYFWGFIGDSILESLTNPAVLIQIVLMLLISYNVSKLIDKKYDIE